MKRRLCLAVALPNFITPACHITTYTSEYDSGEVTTASEFNPLFDFVTSLTYHRVIVAGFLLNPS
jgi:hypothetical protein